MQQVKTWHLDWGRDAGTPRAIGLCMALDTTTLVFGLGICVDMDSGIERISSIYSAMGKSSGMDLGKNMGSVLGMGSDIGLIMSSDIEQGMDSVYVTITVFSRQWWHPLQSQKTLRESGDRSGVARVSDWEVRKEICLLSQKGVSPCQPVEGALEHMLPCQNVDGCVSASHPVSLWRKLWSFLNMIMVRYLAHQCVGPESQ